MGRQSKGMTTEKEVCDVDGFHQNKPELGLYAIFVFA